MIRRLFLLAVLLVPVVNRAEVPVAFDAADAHALQLALRALKMTERDLGFQKTNVEAELVLDKTRAFLQEPLRLPGYAQSVFSNCSGATSLHNLTRYAFQQLETPEPPLDFKAPVISVSAEFLAKLPAPVSSAVQKLTTAAALSSAHLKRALPSTGADALVSFAAETLHIGNDKTEIESWQKTGIDTVPLRQFLDRESKLELNDTELADGVLSAADNLDRSALLAASSELTAAVDSTISALRTTPFNGDFQSETDTELGKIIVTGTGNHTFTNEAFLIIALGGTNTYLNSAGGANGLAGRPYSIVIDLGNNTQFISKRSFSQGAGVFGIGILAALGSNCTFQAKHLSQGAGFFGCGILMTGPGKQTLEADTFCQGAGMFGTGILWQRGENSSCRAAYLAQGFGGPQGVG